MVRAVNVEDLINKRIVLRYFLRVLNEEETKHIIESNKVLQEKPS